MARFVPAGQQAAALPVDEGLDAGQLLGLAKTGTGLYGQAGRFIDMPGAGYTGGLGSLLGLGQGIATGDPGQTTTSGINTGMEALKLADKLGLLGGAGGAGASTGAILAGMGGGGGAASALAPSGAAALTGAGGVGTALAGEGAALGGAGLAGGAAAGGAATGAATAASTLSALAGPLAIALFFIGNGFANMEKKKAERTMQQTRESGDIRRGAGNALDQLKGTQQLAQGMSGLNRFVPAEQAQGLSRAMEQYKTGLSAGPAGERLLSTAGVGGKASKMDALTPEQLANYEKQYRPALQDTQVGYTRAADAAAQTGALPDWALNAFGTSDPASLLQSLGTGFNPYWDVNYQGVVPGTYGTTLPQIMQHFDPSYAQSQTAQRFQQMPDLALAGQTPLTPDQIAAFSQQRQDAATNTLSNYVAGITDHSGADQSGINASGNIGASAPYLGGGSLEAAQAFGMSPQTIADLQSGQTDWQMAVGTSPLLNPGQPRYESAG